AAVPGLQRLDFASSRMVSRFGRTDFVDYKPDIPGIMKLKQLEQISSISLSSMQLRVEDIEAIGASEYLTSLRELDLSYNSVGSDLTLHLLASQALTQLRELSLRACDLGEEGGTHLATWEHLATVTILLLGNNHMGPDATAALLVSPYLG